MEEGSSSPGLPAEAKEFARESQGRLGWPPEAETWNIIFHHPHEAVTGKHPQVTGVLQGWRVHLQALLLSAQEPLYLFENRETDSGRPDKVCRPVDCGKPTLLANLTASGFYVVL